MSKAPRWSIDDLKRIKNDSFDINKVFEDSAKKNLEDVYKRNREKQLEGKETVLMTVRSNVSQWQVNFNIEGTVHYLLIHKIVAPEDFKPLTERVTIDEARIVWAKLIELGATQ